jgi:uncharacterized protein YyaL (SSP411 family)
VERSDGVSASEASGGSPDRRSGGAFYSTLDARSATPATRLDRDEVPEQEEGAFYTWTPAEVRTAMAEEGEYGASVPDGPDVDDDLLADLATDRWGVTAEGNFEGTTVPTVSADYEALAAAHDLTERGVEYLLDEARGRLRRAREQRPRPARDEKVLAGWNGLAISALAEAAVALDPEYAEWGSAALAFVRTQLWDPDAGELARRYKDGEVDVDGYLADYAFLGRGALSLYEVTGDVEHLSLALDLGRAIRERFWDADAGTLYFTPAGGEQLIARPQQIADQSTPSSAGVAVELLLALDHFAPEAFAEIAETVVETHGRQIRSNPLQHASLVLGADALQEGHLELTLVADDGTDGSPTDWRERLGETYLPRRLLAWRPESEARVDRWVDQLDLDETPPIWAGRGPQDGDPTVYACVDRTCSPPKRALRAALDWAQD